MARNILLLYDISIPPTKQSDNARTYTHISHTARTHALIPNHITMEYIYNDTYGAQQGIVAYHAFVNVSSHARRGWERRDQTRLGQAKPNKQTVHIYMCTIRKILRFQISNKTTMLKAVLISGACFAYIRVCVCVCCASAYGYAILTFLTHIEPNSTFFHFSILLAVLFSYMCAVCACEDFANVHVQWQCDTSNIKNTLETIHFFW